MRVLITELVNFLPTFTVVELKTIAKNVQLERYSTLNKEALIKSLSVKFNNQDLIDNLINECTPTAIHILAIFVNKNNFLNYNDLKDTMLEIRSYSAFRKAYAYLYDTFLIIESELDEENNYSCQLPDEIFIHLINSDEFNNYVSNLQMEFDVVEKTEDIAEEDNSNDKNEDLKESQEISFLDDIIERSFTSKDLDQIIDFFEKKFRGKKSEKVEFLLYDLKITPDKILNFLLKEELVNICRSLNFYVSGNKPVLIKRLTENLTLRIVDEKSDYLYFLDDIIKQGKFKDYRTFSDNLKYEKSQFSRDNRNYLIQSFTKLKNFIPTLKLLNINFPSNFKSNSWSNIFLYLNSLDEITFNLLFNIFTYDANIDYKLDARTNDVVETFQSYFSSAQELNDILKSYGFNWEEIFNWDDFDKKVYALNEDDVLELIYNIIYDYFDNENEREYLELIDNEVTEKLDQKKENILENEDITLLQEKQEIINEIKQYSSIKRLKTTLKELEFENYNEAGRKWSESEKFLMSLSKTSLIKILNSVKFFDTIKYLVNITTLHDVINNLFGIEIVSKRWGKIRYFLINKFSEEEFDQITKVLLIQKIDVVSIEKNSLFDFLMKLMNEGKIQESISKLEDEIIKSDPQKYIETLKTDDLVVIYKNIWRISVQDQKENEILETQLQSLNQLKIKVEDMIHDSLEVFQNKQIPLAYLQTKLNIKFEIITEIINNQTNFTFNNKEYKIKIVDNGTPDDFTDDYLVIEESLSKPEPNMKIEEDTETLEEIEHKEIYPFECIECHATNYIDVSDRDFELNNSINEICENCKVQLQLEFTMDNLDKTISVSPKRTEYDNDSEIFETKQIYLAKITLIGKPNIGKTTLIKTLISDNSKTLQTKGIDTFKYYLESEIPLKINFWDFGGQEYYLLTQRPFIKPNGIYFLLIYFRDPKSDLQNLNSWLNYLNSYTTKPLVVLIFSNWDDEGIQEGFKFHEDDVNKIVTNFKDIVYKTKFFVNATDIEDEQIKSLIKEIPNILRTAKYYPTTISKNLQMYYDSIMNIKQNILKMNDINNIPIFKNIDPIALLRIIRNLEEEGRLLILDYNFDLNPYIIKNIGWTSKKLFELSLRAKSNRGILNENELLDFSLHERSLLINLAIRSGTMFNFDSKYIVTEFFDQKKPFASDVPYWNNDNNPIEANIYVPYIPVGFLGEILSVIPQNKYDTMIWKNGTYLIDKLRESSSHIEINSDLRKINIQTKGKHKNQFTQELSTRLINFGDDKHYNWLMLARDNCPICETKFSIDQLIENVWKNKYDIECNSCNSLINYYDVAYIGIEEYQKTNIMITERAKNQIFNSNYLNLIRKDFDGIKDYLKQNLEINLENKIDLLMTRKLADISNNITSINEKVGNIDEMLLRQRELGKLVFEAIKELETTTSNLEKSNSSLFKMVKILSNSNKWNVLPPIVSIEKSPGLIKTKMYVNFGCNECKKPIEPKVIVNENRLWTKIALTGGKIVFRAFQGDIFNILEDISKLKAVKSDKLEKLKGFTANSQINDVEANEILEKIHSGNSLPEQLLMEPPMDLELFNSLKYQFSYSCMKSLNWDETKGWVHKTCI